VATIDVHQHLWPEQLVSALARRDRPPRLRGSTLDLAAEGPCEVDLAAHDLGRRLDALDRDGIDVAVVSLQPTIEVDDEPELLAAYHEGIVELASAASGRLRPLAAGARRDGFAGASLSAAALVSEPAELLGALEAAGEPLFVHPGPPASVPAGAPAWWPAVVDYTAQMQAAYAWWCTRGAAAHPRLNVVFAILAGGAPFHQERLALRDARSDAGPPPGVHLECASYGPLALELSLAACGPGRLLYGSDTPVGDSRPTLRAVRSLGDDVASALLERNPTRLFG